METTRIRDGLVFLGEGLTGVAGTRGRRKLSLWRACYAPLWRVVDNEFMVLSGCGGESLGAWDDFCSESADAALGARN